MMDSAVGHDIPGGGASLGYVAVAFVGTPKQAVVGVYPTPELASDALWRQLGALGHGTAASGHRITQLYLSDLVRFRAEAASEAADGAVLDYKKLIRSVRRGWSAASDAELARLLTVILDAEDPGTSQ